MNAVRGQLHPDEEIVYVAHTTRLTLLLPLLVALAIMGSTIAIWYQTNAPAVLVLGGVLTLMAVSYVLFKWVVLRSNEFVVTSRRIVKQTGIFDKRSTDIYLDKINNVDHYQTIWGRLLGYGDVEIDTASESGTTRFPMVTRPLQFKQTILSRAQDLRMGQVPGESASVSGADRIRQLKALLDDGLVTQAEYEERRKKLLAEL